MSNEIPNGVNRIFGLYKDMFDMNHDDGIIFTYIWFRLEGME